VAFTGKFDTPCEGTQTMLLGQSICFPSHSPVIQGPLLSSIWFGAIREGGNSGLQGLLVYVFVYMVFCGICDIVIMKTSCAHQCFIAITNTCDLLIYQEKRFTS
jgi:hypothetical protein